MLDLVARHADVWDVNLPPLAARVAQAARRARASTARGMAAIPRAIERSMWIFTRVGAGS